MLLFFRTISSKKKKQSCKQTTKSLCPPGTDSGNNRILGYVRAFSLGLITIMTRGIMSKRENNNEKLTRERYFRYRSIEIIERL